MNLIEKEKKYVLQTFKRYNLVLTKGRGKYVWDDRGKRYLDFFGGLSVCNVGHCHPQVVSAIRKQSQQLMHVSGLFYTRPPIELAERLVDSAFPGKVFLSNSGAEANECAIKFARKWGAGRYEVIAFNNSFHGRTLATLSATGQKKFHRGFEPMPAGFKYATFNDLASVEKLITAKTAAVIIEPVQGEGGVNVADKKFLKGLRALCTRKKLLLIFDEIQSGMGRTGTLYAYEQYGVTPDVMTLAKSLGGGLPVGATIVASRYSSAFGYGDHGSTFGGNLVVSAAAGAVLDIINPSLLARVRETGRYLMEQLSVLKAKHSCIREVRGVGLMAGIELDFPGKEIVQWCQEKGLLINCTQDTVIRFLPPLIIDKKDVDFAVRLVNDALQQKSA